MSQPPAESSTQITRYEALAAMDGEGFEVSPACLLVERPSGRGPCLLAAGTPDQVRSHPAFAGAGVVQLPRAVLIPGLVNAHTHLDLTHLGPRPFDPEAGFVGWVDHIRLGRHADEADIRASVRRGVDLSLAGGTVAVGDIAGAVKGLPTTIPCRALAESPLAGVSFVEFFGIGNRFQAGIERLPALLAMVDAARDAQPHSPNLRFGLQPHAPYTVDLRLYAMTAAGAAARAIPLATHLAETPEEHEFVARGAGPQRARLERLGIWDASVLEMAGAGHHPVSHLEPALRTWPFLAAHVNDCDDAAIGVLQRTGASGAYCPRASAYFGAERAFGPHRYRDMIRAGVNVALGTDSIVNLPDAAARPESGGVSVLDEMRFLHRRDATDPRLLLGMATTGGARALGLPPHAVRFSQRAALAGLVAVQVDGAVQNSVGAALMRSSHPTRLIFSAHEARLME